MGSAKKTLLFVIHQLTVGGAQKSLLSALNAIDYDTYDVTLYVRKNRLALLPQVDGRVRKIIVNEDASRYYRRPRAVALYLLSHLAQLWGGSGERFEKRLRQYVVDAGMQYEKRHYFSDGKRYDVAISYIQGYTAQFTWQYVPANRKIMFYHDSTDNNHELHQSVMAGFERIAAVSEGCRKMLQEAYPDYADKIIYIENCVDRDFVLAEAGKKTIDRGNRKIVLCTCGRISPVKGFDLAVAAAKQLKEKGHDFLWYFVGDGPEREALEKQIDASLKDNIHITGLLENPYPYIAQCDIYVQPSYEEAHPLAILEAQILCRPVVSTATAGGKTTISDGETGVLAAITAESLAEKIDEMINDRALRERIGENLGKFDWAMDKKRFRAAWKTLLEEGQKV